MKNSELRAKALLAALIAELKGLRKAFIHRYKQVQSYKVTQIVLDKKRGQRSPDTDELQNLLSEKESQIHHLNEKLLYQISSHYEYTWSDTLQQVTSGYAATKTDFYANMLIKLQ